MGSKNSCLPVKLSSFHPSRRRSSISKLKLEQQEPICGHAMDINHGSEDEFLLLPGITRQLAHNIIQYRHIHDGFKQINELLQVDGITSRKFKRICADISINKPPSSNTRKKLLNLNLATCDELRAVPDLTPVLVARIIARRERKGPFRSIEDLLKIKGIDYNVLAAVRPYVTVDREQEPTSMNHSSGNNLHPTLSQNKNATDTLSLLLQTLPPELQTLLARSIPQRPSPVDNNNNNNNSKPNLFRVASWNLQQLTLDKVQNPGVREVICRVILANNFSLIGIQEIADKESLDLIVKELNNPTIPVIKEWPNHRSRRWNYTLSDVAGRLFQGSEYLGFLYDESIGIKLKQASLLPFTSHFTRAPFLTIFRIHNRFELVFVNVHLKARRPDDDKSERTKDEAKALSVLAQAMKDTIGQKHVVICGDFNLMPTAPEFQALLQCNYSYTIQANTNISLKTPQGSTCVDNIWLSAEAKALTTGNSGVIRDNLSSLWIPAGWTWGGLVSDHCPIWIEFDLS